MLLQWKHPGDDFNTGILGTTSLPATYYIQYSSLTSVIWSTANAQVSFGVVNKNPYSTEEYYFLGSSFTDIYEGVTYYFRIWVRDSEGNLSDISLGTTNWATLCPSVDAICVFFDSTTLTEIKIPKYKKWVQTEFYWTNLTTNTLSFYSEAWGKYVLRACPRRNEFILAICSEDGANDDVEVQVYKGDIRKWDNLNRVSADAGSSADYQPFDVAYEDNSGRAIVCYRDDGVEGKSNRVYYQIWNGSTWSSGDIYSGIEVESSIRFIRLVSKPGSDEILMAIQDLNRNHYVCFWDGTSWSGLVKIGAVTAPSSEQQCFDITYECITKRAMIVFSSGSLTQPYFSLYDGSSWSTPQPATFTAATANIRWIRLASDPSSDKVVLVAEDNNRRIGYSIWNGISWTNKGLLADLPDTLSIDVRPFDVCWLGSTEKPMIVYSNNTSTPAYITGTNFENSGLCINIGAKPYWITLFSDHNASTETVHLITADETSPDSIIKIQTWDGSQWRNLKTLSSKSYSGGCSAGSFRYDDTAPSADNVPPAAVTSLVVSTTTVELQARFQWISPGDNGWSDKLVCGSQYRIQYSTWDNYQDIIWSTSNAQIIISTYNVDPYQLQTYLYNLPYEATYYFRLWTRDDAFNWSLPSNIATGYFIFRPAAVTNLSALPSRWGRCIDLSWTAPGDDGWSGNITGGKFRIRYSTYVTSDPNFWTTDTGWNDFSNKYEIMWDTNVVALSQQFRRLTGLHQGVTYYIRLWTR
ncbi:MAG: hypothetical protein RMJ13_07650, partial [Elusimicrobiota bacterium]|nr:hypothetical protein [Elusimicrobiota bacterium]